MSIPAILEQLRLKFGANKPSIYDCVQFGIELEQDRIVKDLEVRIRALDTVRVTSDDGDIRFAAEVRISALRDVAELIKGEQK